MLHYSLYGRRAVIASDLNTRRVFDTLAQTAEAIAATRVTIAQTRLAIANADRLRLLDQESAPPVGLPSTTGWSRHTWRS
jgi:hypothetical protein